MQRAGFREVLPPVSRVQLGHEPNHLFLPRQGDERYIQADPVLSEAGEHKWNGGGVRSLSFLPQPHCPLSTQ